jgi:predicted nicotinamide N-methyase
MWLSRSFSLAIATDKNYQLQMIEENLRLNKIPGEKCMVTALDWSQWSRSEGEKEFFKSVQRFSESVEAAASRSASELPLHAPSASWSRDGVDLIVGADILYDRAAVGELVNVLRDLAEPSKTKIIIAQKRRHPFVEDPWGRVENISDFEVAKKYEEADVIVWELALIRKPDLKL